MCILTHYYFQFKRSDFRALRSSVTRNRKYQTSPPRCAPPPLVSQQKHTAVTYTWTPSAMMTQSTKPEVHNALLRKGTEPRPQASCNKN